MRVHFLEQRNPESAEDKLIDVTIDVPAVPRVGEDVVFGDERGTQKVIAVVWQYDVPIDDDYWVAQVRFR